MGTRASHHFTTWALPIACSLGLVGSGLWFADRLAVVGARPVANLRDLPVSGHQSSAAPGPKKPTKQPTTHPAQSQDTPAAGAIGFPQQLASARPILLSQRKIAGESIYLTMIDLSDPAVFLGLGLAHNAKQANSRHSSKGDEQFIQMVRRHRAAVTVNGTFFSMDQQKRVMGNMVSGGRFLKFSPWENYGTTFGLRVGNRPEMLTARIDGQPKWQQHWFSITAGPRLLRQGQVQVKPQAEGFTDRSMTEGKSLRMAIGYPKYGRQLMLITFLTPVTLQKAAEIMGYLGNYEAMNLDGGTSVGLAKGNKILKAAGRELTNVITIYDAQHPAPKHLRDSWRAFQRGDHIIAQGPISEATTSVTHP